MGRGRRRGGACKHAGTRGRRERVRRTMKLEEVEVAVVGDDALVVAERRGEVACRRVASPDDLHRRRRPLVRVAASQIGD